MTVLFDSGVGLFDAASGLFDDAGVVNGTATATGLEAQSSIGTVTSNGTRSETAIISGVSVASATGIVTASSDSAPVVKSGTSRRKKPGKFIPYQGGGYTPPPVSISAHAICLAQEADATVGKVSATGSIHINGRAAIKSVKVETGIQYAKARGVINPTDEEWQLLLAA
jgi:hypothetical protein